MVDSIQGVGVYVKSTMSVPTDWMHSVEPQDIISVRTILEPNIAHDAALNISEADKKWLQSIMDRFRAEAEADKYTIETDKEFHICIAHASGNSLYAAIMELVVQAMDQQMWKLMLVRTIETPKYRERNYVEHMYIAQSIMEGNAEEAYSRMKVHMENLMTRYWE